MKKLSALAVALLVAAQNAAAGVVILERADAGWIIVQRWIIVQVGGLFGA